MVTAAAKKTNLKENAVAVWGVVNHGRVEDWLDLRTRPSTREGGGMGWDAHGRR